MFFLLSFCVLFVLDETHGGFINAGPVSFDVELHTFSGRQSPNWPIGRRNPYFGTVATYLDRSRPSRLSDQLGYRGFEVEMRNMFGQRVTKTIGAGTNPRLEILLLRSSPSRISESVKRNIVSTIRGAKTVEPYVTMTTRPFPGSRFRTRVCRLPRYDPERWNTLPTIRLNNCYNYATQRQTNTFAQPGRASGRTFSRPLTASNVIRATVRDGLIPLPFFNPRMFPGVCFIALAIWPDTDYHFYRLDSNMVWSHKPGKTSAKITDNSGNQIIDPKYADRGSYTIFAGYLGNHAGVRVI